MQFPLNAQKKPSTILDLFSECPGRESILTESVPVVDTLFRSLTKISPKVFDSPSPRKKPSTTLDFFSECPGRESNPHAV